MLKNFFILVFAGALFLVPGTSHAQYRVSGVVDFSYRNYETKSGKNVTSSYEEFIQNYQLNLDSYIWDPRFLVFNAGTGYSVISSLSPGTADSDSLDYRIDTTFFPGMKISWNLHGSQSTNNVESTSSLAGYDLKTTTYGGTLNLLLSGFGRGNGGNNNNNNNNNNFGSRSMPLPDITLSRFHREAESQSSIHPIHEIRDDTRGSLRYVWNIFEVNLDAEMQNYDEKIGGSKYDFTTLNLFSTLRLSSYADFKVEGRYNERNTQNMSGFEAKDKTSGYSTILDVKERNRIRQYYRYDYNKWEAALAESITQVAEARVYYRIVEELELLAGLNYGASDVISQATSTSPEMKTATDFGGVLTGFRYLKTYTPNFLGPFVFTTNYDFNWGFARYSSPTAGQDAGRFYTNMLGLSMNTTAWKYDNLSLSYNFNNKRDSSPLGNDLEMQNFRIHFVTSRIPKTAVRLIGTYNSQEAQSGMIGSILIPTPAGSHNQSRQYTYEFNVDHTVNPNLLLSAGTIRGQTTTNTFSLVTITSSSVNSQDELYYATANFNYLISRNLIYRLLLREESRSSLPGDTRAHEVNTGFNYRLRQIFISLDYRWRQDIPDYTLRSTQQYYYAKLTRPF